MEAPAAAVQHLYQDTPDPTAAAAEQEQHRPEKRQRLDGDQQRQQHDGGGGDDGPLPPGPPPAAQLTQALARIANHISSASKFPKASQLLRQVLDAVDRAHRCVL